jgi:hypothetical protein
MNQNFSVDITWPNDSKGKQIVSKTKLLQTTFLKSKGGDLCCRKVFVMFVIWLGKSMFIPCPAVHML